jgi:hypothetical protein
VFSLKNKYLILELSIEIWYELKLFLTLCLEAVLCLVCGGCETDIKMPGVHVCCSVCNVMPSGGMVFTS